MRFVRQTLRPKKALIFWMCNFNEKIPTIFSNPKLLKQTKEETEKYLIFNFIFIVDTITDRYNHNHINKPKTCAQKQDGKIYQDVN